MSRERMMAAYGITGKSADWMDMPTVKPVERQEMFRHTDQIPEVEREKDEQGFRYFFYPMVMNELLWKGKIKEFKRLVPYYHAWYYGQRFIKPTEEHLKKQLAYLVLTYPGHYEKSRLNKIVSTYGEEFTEQDANGFGDGFEGFYGENLEVYNRLIECEDFREEALKLIKTKDAMKMFSVGGNVFNVIDNVSIINDLCSANPMLTSIKDKNLDNIKEPTELAFYQAIKSFIRHGKKVGFTTRFKIIARAFGYDKFSDIPPKVFQSEVFQNYYKRRQYYKMMDIMQEVWEVKKMKAGQDIAIATDKTVALKDLKDAIAFRKLKSLEKKVTEAREARDIEQMKLDAEQELRQLLAEKESLRMARVGKS